MRGREKIIGLNEGPKKYGLRCGQGISGTSHLRLNDRGRSYAFCTHGWRAVGQMTSPPYGFRSRGKPKTSARTGQRLALGTHSVPEASGYCLKEGKKTGQSGGPTHPVEIITSRGPQDEGVPFKSIVHAGVNGIADSGSLDANAGGRTRTLSNRVAVDGEVLQNVGLPVRRVAAVGDKPHNAAHAVDDRIRVNGNVGGIGDQDSCTPPKPVSGGLKPSSRM